MLFEKLDGRRLDPQIYIIMPFSIKNVMINGHLVLLFSHWFYSLKVPGIICNVI